MVQNKKKTHVNGEKVVHQSAIRFNELGLLHVHYMRDRPCRAVDGGRLYYDKLDCPGEDAEESSSEGGWSDDNTWGRVSQHPYSVLEMPFSFTFLFLQLRSELVMSLRYYCALEDRSRCSCLRDPQPRLLGDQPSLAKNPIQPRRRAIHRVPAGPARHELPVCRVHSRPTSH